VAGDAMVLRPTISTMDQYSRRIYALALSW
jgi:hypothetical protein